MSDGAYIIRPAEFRDAELIFEIIKSNPEELLARPLGDIIQNIDRFLVCEVDGRVGGTISWQILPEIGVPTNPSVEIKSLAVASEFRGRGIGRELVRKAVEKIYQTHPAQVIVLTFYPEFFRKQGFAEVPKEKLMHKLYTGCISCSKYDSPFTCPETAMALEP